MDPKKLREMIRTHSFTCPCCGSLLLVEKLANGNRKLVPAEEAEENMRAGDMEFLNYTGPELKGQ